MKECMRGSRAGGGGVKNPSESPLKKNVWIRTYRDLKFKKISLNLIYKLKLIEFVETNKLNS